MQEIKVQRRTGADYLGLNQFIRILVQQWCNPRKKCKDQLEVIMRIYGQVERQFPRVYEMEEIKERVYEQVKVFKRKWRRQNENSDTQSMYEIKAQECIQLYQALQLKNSEDDEDCCKPLSTSTPLTNSGEVTNSQPPAPNSLDYMAFWLRNRGFSLIATADLLARIDPACN
ncbi:hypothetical protein Ciccas_007544 [Cichlidogyrus casuarinus]|uniref:Uncharacterized protein n=1 Tax=Cichlidogyrus casuarinus TaxID=1844966 RepID=A0ABD2Q2M4_9PLAT